jgi:hypothetical protein
MKEYQVLGYYGQGWEEVFTASTMKEAREILQDYRLNESAISFKIVSHDVSKRGYLLRTKEVSA